MDAIDVLRDLFSRIPEEIHVAVDGLSAEELVQAPTADANTIGWLVWHLTRVQDDHVAELLGRDQVWTSGPWPQRFSLASDADDTGYGHTAEQVRAVRPESVDTLLDYYAAVERQTKELLDSLSADDLDRVIDERWDPPVTLGVRLVSVADDDSQHAGQAAYVRGLLGL